MCVAVNLANKTYSSVLSHQFVLRVTQLIMALKHVFPPVSLTWKPAGWFRETRQRDSIDVRSKILHFGECWPNSINTTPIFALFFETDKWFFHMFIFKLARTSSRTVLSVDKPKNNDPDFVKFPQQFLALPFCAYNKQVYLGGLMTVSAEQRGDLPSYR